MIVASDLVRKRDRDIVCEATTDFTRQFKVNIGIIDIIVIIGIIGISGIEADGTPLDYDYDYREVRVTQAIIEQSTQVWLVVDHTKFGRHALVRMLVKMLVRMGMPDRPTSSSPTCRRRPRCRKRSTMPASRCELVRFATAH